MFQGSCKDCYAALTPKYYFSMDFEWGEGVKEITMAVGAELSLGAGLEVTMKQEWTKEGSKHFLTKRFPTIYATVAGLPFWIIPQFGLFFPVFSHSNFSHMFCL